MRKNQTKKNQTAVKPLSMKATVSGFNCSNEAFTEDLVFTLLPPDTPDHYGTGYYMVVKTPSQDHLVDVRYERTPMSASWLTAGSRVGTARMPVRSRRNSNTLRGLQGSLKIFQNPQK